MVLLIPGIPYWALVFVLTRPQDIGMHDGAVLKSERASCCVLMSKVRTSKGFVMRMSKRKPDFAVLAVLIKSAV